MRKVLFLSLLLIALTGLASANSITFESGMVNGGTINSSSASGVALGDFFDGNGLSVAQCPLGLGFCDFSTQGSFDFSLGSLTVTGAVSEPSNVVSTALFTGNYISSPASCTGTNMCNLSGFVTGTFDPILASDLGLAGSKWAISGFAISNSNGVLDSVQVTFSSVPEPASLLLLASGMGAIGSLTRKRLAR